MLEYTYPRLDIDVSKKLNHLLKSPFVVHPGTGRVCVPIDTRRLADFDPLAVPTVQGLLAEIDAWGGAGDGDDVDDDGDGRAASSDDGRRALADWQKTSLRPYVDHFRSFVAAVIRDERDGRVKAEGGGGGEPMEF